MIASQYSVGTRFKHVETGSIVSVVILEEQQVFECETWGDIWEYLDESYYIEI